MGKILDRPFTRKNTIPASQLREISQKRLQEMINDNQLLALIIKDEMAITMMGMEEFEALRDYVEQLEQLLDEAGIVNQLSETYFETPKNEFMEMPAGMSAKEYREWRKGTSD
ncbi:MULTISPECIES: hypothetical protein [Oceanobacillus]|uniref:Uncharacterized protein n=2 Tax=Oceanobacillus TaxID=182709 RepID=A0A0A1MD05_9BACI|nr:hypothetical protein [Oceanobacillus oncorhynchi]MDM8101304.1 hypothetical protein [Oceanobacillus oncorhynchi]CEI80958.1 hypothetical protein BN997_00771 [Oceanobacillus oncorhynchi]